MDTTRTATISTNEAEQITTDRQREGARDTKMSVLEREEGKGGEVCRKRSYEGHTADIWRGHSIQQRRIPIDLAAVTNHAAAKLRGLGWRVVTTNRMEGRTASPTRS